MTDRQNTKRLNVRTVLSYFFKYGVPLLVSVLLCLFLFRDIDWNEMIATIRTCHFEFIGIMLIISVFSHIFRAMRWRIQLNALDIPTPLFPLILSIFGTYAVNLVLPRLGEIWRTGYIAKRQGAQFSNVFGSMVADRFADMITVLFLTVVTFIFAASDLNKYMSENTTLVSALFKLMTSPWAWGALVLFVAVLWWFVRKKGNNPVLVKIQGFIKGLWQGFAVVTKMPGKGRWLILTVLIWGCYFLQLFVAFFAFDFTAEVIHNYGITAVLVTFVLSSIAMGVPANGGIGPWQWAVIFALLIYGVGKEPATAFANLVLGCNTLLIILLGIFTFVCITISKRTR